jgi:hypothetical protein
MIPNQPKEAKLLHVSVLPAHAPETETLPSNSPDDEPSVTVPLSFLSELELWEDWWTIGNLDLFKARLRGLAARPPVGSSSLQFADLGRQLEATQKRLADMEALQAETPRLFTSRVESAEQRLNKRVDDVDTANVSLGRRVDKSQSDASSAATSVNQLTTRVDTLVKDHSTQQDGLGKAFDICSNHLTKPNNLSTAVHTRIDERQQSLFDMAIATKQLLPSTKEGALAQAQALLAQVTELHGHVLAVLHPTNRRSLKELWRQIKNVNNLVQRHNTMFLEVDHDIRRLLPVLPTVRNHAQDILALWVHIRDAMFIIDPEWTKRCSVPSYPTRLVKYLSSVPITLPKGFDLIVASPDTFIPYR